MVAGICLFIVCIGVFIFAITISFDLFLDAWKKLPDTFKITPVGKSKTSDPSQDKPAYLVDVRLDAMQRDIDRLHCELKSLESRINNRKD